MSCRSITAPSPPAATWDLNVSFCGSSEKYASRALTRFAIQGDMGSSAFRTARPVGEDALDDERLQARQVLERLDVAQAQVVGRDVRDDADVGPVVTQAEAEQPAARRLESREGHRRIAKHGLRRGRAGAVALHDLLAADVDALGRREAHVVAGVAGDVREQARRRRLAVRAGDRDDRDARRSFPADRACR